MSDFKDDISELLSWLNIVRRRHIDILKYIHNGDKFYVIRSGKIKSIYDPINNLQLLHVKTDITCMFSGGFTHWQYEPPIERISDSNEIQQEKFFPQKAQPPKFTLTPEEMLKLKKAQAEYDYAVRITDEIVESDRLTPVEMQLDILSEWEMKMPLYKDRLETYISELSTYICRAYSGVNKV